MAFRAGVVNIGQGSASVKCVIADGGGTDRDHNVLHPVAVGKCIIGDGGHAAAQLNSFQVHTVVEGTGADGDHIVADDKIRQTHTAVKGVVAYSQDACGNGILAENGLGSGEQNGSILTEQHAVNSAEIGVVCGNSEAVQIIAGFKRQRADGLDTVAQRYMLQTGAAKERSIADDGYTVTGVYAERIGKMCKSKLTYCSNRITAQGVGDGDFAAGRVIAISDDGFAVDDLIGQIAVRCRLCFRGEKGEAKNADDQCG